MAKPPASLYQPGHSSFQNMPHVLKTPLSIPECHYSSLCLKLRVELPCYAMCNRPVLSLFICAASLCRRSCWCLPCMEDAVCGTPSAGCTWCTVAAWSCWRKKCYLGFGRWDVSVPVVFACVASFEVLVSFCRYLDGTSCYLREAGCLGRELQALDQFPRTDKSNFNEF